MRKRFLTAALVLSMAVIVMTLGPLSDRPGIGHPQLERFAAYFVLGATWALAFPRRMLTVGIVIAAAAAGLELAQFLAPDRDPRFVDAMAKIVGDVTGVATTMFFDARRRQTGGRSASDQRPPADR